jgi:hypothetical protein
MKKKMYFLVTDIFQESVVSLTYEYIFDIEKFENWYQKSCYL